MSWHFSAALVAEYSAANCSGGQRFAQLKSNPTADVCSCKDKTTDCSIHSRFGMTLPPSEANLGVELLTWFQGASRVRTSVAQAREQASTGSEAGCGERWRGSLAKYDPASRSWRTAQCSLFGGLEEFSETWPRWGSMQGGVVCQRPAKVPGTFETASGFVPTPIKSDGGGGCRLKFDGPYGMNLRDWWASQGLGRKRQQRHPGFWEWLMGWPIAWTGLARLETDKFQQWLEQHGSC